MTSSTPSSVRTTSAPMSENAPGVSSAALFILPIDVWNASIGMPRSSTTSFSLDASSAGMPSDVAHLADLERQRLEVRHRRLDEQTDGGSGGGGGLRTVRRERGDRTGHQRRRLAHHTR